MNKLMYTNDKGLTIALLEVDSMFVINITSEEHGVKDNEVYFTRVLDDALLQFNDFKKILNDKRK